MKAKKDLKSPSHDLEELLLSQLLGTNAPLTNDSIYSHLVLAYDFVAVLLFLG